MKKLSFEQIGKGLLFALALWLAFLGGIEYEKRHAPKASLSSVSVTGPYLPMTRCSAWDVCGKQKECVEWKRINRKKGVCNGEARHAY